MGLRVASSGPMQALFRRWGSVHDCRRYTFLFHDGDPPTSVYFVEKGLVKVCHSTTAGRDLTLFLRYPGDVFGFAEIVAGRTRQRQAQCLKPTRVWVISEKAFHQALDEEPGFLPELFLAVTTRLLETQRRLEDVVSVSAAGRLAVLLVQLGDPPDRSPLTVELEFSHEELANIVACSRQTVTEILNRWRNTGVIRYAGKIITIPDVETFLDKSTQDRDLP